LRHTAHSNCSATTGYGIAVVVVVAASVVAVATVADAAANAAAAATKRNPASGKLLCRKCPGRNGVRCG